MLSRRMLSGPPVSPTTVPDVRAVFDSPMSASPMSAQPNSRRPARGAGQFKPRTESPAGFKLAGSQRAEIHNSSGSNSSTGAIRSHQSCGNKKMLTTCAHDQDRGLISNRCVKSSLSSLPHVHALNDEACCERSVQKRNCSIGKPCTEERPGGCASANTG